MNKVCIVTGGTRGIGLETVKTFLNAGYHVVLYGSREETVQKALAALSGENVEGRWTPLTDYEKIKAMTSPPGLARSTCSSITRVSRTPPRWKSTPSKISTASWT